MYFVALFALTFFNVCRGYRLDNNNTIDCGDVNVTNGVCTIYCDDKSDCQGQIINASSEFDNITTFNLICETSSSCTEAIVYCPHELNTDCNIDCLGRTSCETAQLFSESSDMIVNCSGSFSCQDILLNATNAQKLNLTCGSSSCSNLVLPNETVNAIYCPETPDAECIVNAAKPSALCAFNIFAANEIPNSSGSGRRTTTLEINCMAKDSCSYNIINARYINNLQVTAVAGSSFSGVVFASNANNVVIKALNDSTLLGLILHASNAKSVIVYCSSSGRIGSTGFVTGCYDGNFELPPSSSGSTVFNCYGFGCEDAIVYLDSDKNQLVEKTEKYTVNVSVNGCGYCNTFGKCIKEWEVRCGHVVNGWDGKKCVSSQCNCKDIHRASFVNTKDSLCSGHGNKWHAKKHHSLSTTWIAIIIVASLVVVIAIGGSVVYFMRRRKRQDASGYQAIND